MFERPHHQRIAQVLLSLNGPLLRESGCLFAGGTAIVLSRGEYRESVDIDFLVSDSAGYREIRDLLAGRKGIEAILKDGVPSIETHREVRADQYGIRTMLLVGGVKIKFEIVLEGRISFDDPGAEDDVCGIATLSLLDLATSKLLANSGRWYDDGVFNRDLIDLAMLSPSIQTLKKAVRKAEVAYGKAILRDMDKAIQALYERPGRFDRCMGALGITLPKAVLWDRIRKLRRVLP